MANNSIADFKARLTGGGARANLFRVHCNFPDYVDAGDEEKASFLIKTAALPASLIANITIPFRGRQLQVAGDRSFEPWAITVLNDTDFDLRNAFEQWMNGINQHAANTGLTDPDEYMMDLWIEQLDKDGNPIKTYDFRGCWPSAVSAIDVSYDAENTIEEFGVEFQVTWWESDTSTDYSSGPTVDGGNIDVTAVEAPPSDD